MKNTSDVLKKTFTKLLEAKTTIIEIKYTQKYTS